MRASSPYSKAEKAYLMKTEINIGIDTSQSQLDIFVRPSGDFFSVENTPQGAKNHWAQGFQDVETDGELTMRIGLSWTYKGPLEPSPLEEQEAVIAHRQQFASDLINPDFVKLSINGTVGATGLVIEPYAVTGDNGLAFYDVEELADDVTRFDAMGMGITAHANADGAVRQFLDAIETEYDVDLDLSGNPGDSQYQILDG